MRIGFDVDGVLADFNTRFIEEIKQITGRNLFPPDFVIREWNYPVVQLDYSREEIDHVWQVLKSRRNFWDGLSAFPGVIQALDEAKRRQLHFGDTIYFITSRVGYQAKEQTEFWLRAHGFADPTVLICHDKGAAAKALDLTHYIDDRPENVMSVRVLHPSCRTYMLTQTWNVSFWIPDVIGIGTALEFIEACR